VISELGVAKGTLKTSFYVRERTKTPYDKLETFLLLKIGKRINRGLYQRTSTHESWPSAASTKPKRFWFTKNEKFIAGGRGSQRRILERGSRSQGNSSRKNFIIKVETGN